MCNCGQRWSNRLSISAAARHCVFLLFWLWNKQHNTFTGSTSASLFSSSGATCSKSSSLSDACSDAYFRIQSLVEIFWTITGNHLRALTTINRGFKSIFKICISILSIRVRQKKTSGEKWSNLLFISATAGHYLSHKRLMHKRGALDCPNLR